MRGNNENGSSQLSVIKLNCTKAVMMILKKIIDSFDSLNGRYNTKTSTGHHTTKARCRLLARDFADNFSIRYFVMSQKIQNDCRQNYIAIYTFTA